MKRLLFFLMATLFAMQGFSQATLNEGFEGTNFPPDDWARATTQGTEAWERYTSSSPRGTACASVNYESGGHTNYLITPKLIVSSDQDSIVYWVKTSYDFGGTTLNVLVSTTDNAVTSFSTTSLQTVSTLSESWVRKSIPLTNYIGEEIYIAFQVVDFYGSRVMLDDVTGPELFVPTCPKPTALSATNPTTTGVDLGWTDDTGLIWNIEYMLATETDWTNATTLYSVMNPHTFTSLNASTSYKARVQTDCGIEQSDWTSPITFMTACDPITVLPYSDSFDTYGTVTGSFPPCWSRPVLNTTTPFPSIETTNNSAPASIKFQSASATAPTYVITPQFADDINSLRVKFWLRKEGASSGTIEVGVMSDPTDTSTFELVSSVSPNAFKVWTQYEVMFNGTTLTGPNNYIAFRHITNASNWYYWLDDVIVDYIPSCSKPGSIDAENITTTSADITWAPAHDTDYAWWLYYKENSSTDFDSVYISGSPIYSFFALTANTEYDIYVRTDCGTETSEPSDMISFRTPCEPIAILPYTENFDSYGVVAGSFLPCWSRPVLNTTTPYPSINTTNHTPPASIRFQSASAAEPTYVVTPRFIDDISQLRVKFWLKAENTSSSGVMEVGVMSDPTDVSSFELVGTVNPSSTDWTEYEFLFNTTTLTGPNNYIAFKHVTVSSVYYYWLDDVTVDYIPSCYMPSNILVSNTTTTSVDISWTPANDTDYAWWLYYKENSSTDFDSVYISGTPSYPFTNLNPSSGYDLYLKTDCGSELSEETSIFSFRTECGAISSLPYSESFDTYGTGSGVFLTCWGRVTSNTYPYISTTNSSAPGSMYMYTASGAYNYIATPEFDASIPINSLSANFYLRKSTLAYNITVGVMSDPSDTTTFDSLINLTPTAINSWQVFNVDFIDYTGTGQYIAFKVQGYGAANGMYLDDLIIYTTPSCAIPTGITRQNTTSNSFDLDWDNTDDANCIGWIIDYKEHDATVWQEEFVTYHPHTLANLSPNTLYNIRLRAICSSGDTTLYTSILTYGMPCEPISVFPWEEGFEDSWWVGDGLGGTADSRPWCWININGGASTSYLWRKTTTSSYIHSGTGAAQMYTGSTTSQLGDWLITPAFSLTGNQRLRFWAKGYSTYTDNLTVKILDLTTNPTVSSASDTSLFVELMSNTVIPASDWTEYEINLSDFTGDFRFAFVRNTTGGYYLNIDDVSISDIPACARPTAINTGYVIDEEIELSWIPGNTGDAAWYLYWKAASATDYDSVYVTQQPYVLQNLTANTTYNIYLRTDCLTELSEATNPISIKTALCAPVTTFPYTEGFDSLGATAGVFPPCWARPIIYSDYPKTSTEASRVHSAPASLEIHSAVGSPTYAVTPPMGEDINTLRVTFWAMAESTTSSGTIEVGVMSDPNNLLTFESVQVIQPTNTSYNQYEVIFAGTTLNGLNKSIAFRQNTVSAIYYYWIDDVVVDYIPACSYPALVEVSNISTTSADVTWAPANATDNAWWLYYKTAAATSYDSIYITGTPTYSFTTLTANTLYNIYVSTDCGTELSEPTGVSNFRTACAAISTLPFFENFDTYGTGTSTYPLPNCWSRINTYTSSTMPYISTTNHSAPGCLYFYTPTSGTYNIGIMPPFDASIPINTLMAAFYYRNNSATDRLIIGAMSDPTDATTFDSITTITASTTATWQFFEVNLSSYTGTGQYLAFKNAYTTANSYAYIDDLTISTIPTCPNTYSLSVASVTSSDVTLNWSAVNSAGQGWEISYDAVGTGFDPTTGIIIPVADATGVPPYTISGLIPSTPYSFAVRQACGGNWSNVVTVNTMGLPAQLPYTCDFEDVDERNSWSISNGGATNKWFIGTAVSATPITGNSLYISNDNGVSNAYTLTTISTVVASRLIEFDGSGGYTLTFDSKLGGESSFDYIKVYIVDQDTTYVGSASTPYYGSSTYSTGVVLFNGANAYFNNVSNPTTVNSHSVVVPYQGEAGTVRKLMFVWRNDGGVGTTPPAAIDNISITPITCAAPTLTISNISQTSADASWTSTASDNGWWLYYKTESATDYDSIYITGTPTYSFTTFTANTAYNAYVRLDCGTDLSAPSSIINFRTACDNISTLPYSENFEGYGTGTSIMPACWVRTTTYADRPYVNTGGYSGNCLYFYAGTAGTYNIAAMNPIDASIPINSLMATFYYKNYASTNRLVVGVMTDPTNATTFDSITTIAAPSTATWAEYEVNFSSYTGTGTYIAFKNIYTTTNGYAYLDNLVIDYTPACARPISATASNITGTTADLSWTPGNASDVAWKIYYRPSGTSDWDSVMVTNNPYNLTGLLASTNYEVGISTDCGNGEFSNMRLVNFRTQCGSITTFPWDNGFESITTEGEFPNCFVTSGNTNTLSTGMSSQDNNRSARTGSKYATFRYGCWNRLFTPEFDLVAGASYTFSFWYKADQSSGWDLSAGLYSIIGDTNSLVSEIGSAITTGITTSYQQFTGTFTVSTSNTYSIAIFCKANYTPWYLTIDDLSLESDNPCPPPTNITVTPSNISANVTWTAGDVETSWEVRLETTGTPEVTSITNHPLTGLTPSTAYTVYVRANCGTGYSSWIPKQFTTTDVPTPPTVTTAVPTTLITQTTAVLNGTYVEVSDPILATGFEYKTVAETTWTDQLLVDATTPFTYTATGLTSNTDYEAKAYVTTTAFGKTYGNTINFTTLAIIPPTVTTDSVRNITQTSATFYGKITANTEAIEARGFEYKLSTEGWEDAINISATGVTEITAYPSTLQAGLTYNVRAYGRTLTATTYGLELIFNTPTDGYTEPIVITNDAIPTSGTEATLSGEITAGSEAITNQGFEWKATSEETWIPITVNGTTITYTLTGLTEGISYDYKAFATTAIETTYGNIKTFTPLGLYDIDGNEISIMMYPNPATHQTNLVISGISGETKIILSDVQGRVLKTIDAKPVSGTLEQTIDLNNLAKGVYYIRIQNTDINRTQKLIVK